MSLLAKVAFMYFMILVSYIAALFVWLCRKRWQNQPLLQQESCLLQNSHNHEKVTLKHHIKIAAANSQSNFAQLLAADLEARLIRANSDLFFLYQGNSPSECQSVIGIIAFKCLHNRSLQKREKTGKEYGCFPFVWKTKIFKWKINYILESLPRIEVFGGGKWQNGSSSNITQNREFVWIG